MTDKPTPITEDAEGELRALAARAIYDAIDPVTGDHIATTIHMSDHHGMCRVGETVKEQLVAVMQTCAAAADAVLALVLAALDEARARADRAEADERAAVVAYIRREGGMQWLMDTLEAGQHRERGE